jgi:tetratricopeptide (TPR) repeat protein
VSVVFRSVRNCAACFCSIIVVLAPIRAYPQEPANGGILKGYVHDSSARPVANAAVFLRLSTQSPTPAIAPESTETDSAGAYRFALLPAGAYTLRAQKNGYAEAIVSHIPLARKELKKIDLVLLPLKTSESQPASPTGAPTANPGVAAPNFFDEPQFTVAGVTAGSSAGGHGSDTVLRTGEALARDTVSLNSSSDEKSSANALPSAAAENSLRNAVAQNPQDAGLHHQLAGVEEALGHPFEAVREYQRAAELDPREPYLFDWGTELLTHRALEPATEVFASGNRLFPRSVRMLIALGVSWYARGSYDQATRCLVNASDLAPDDAAPYLFLGKMLKVTPTLSKESVDRLARFAQLQPDNALANYYYAVALWNTIFANADEAPPDAKIDAIRSAQVEALLQKAVHLDAKLSAAYLQLGIVYSQRRDFSQAIAEYRKAIAVSSEHDETLAEAHYRLAQAYARTGDTAKAQVELELHADLDKQIMESVDRERREVQQFVISLQNGNATSQPQP